MSNVRPTPTAQKHASAGPSKSDPGRMLIAVLEIVILYGFAILFAGALFASSLTKLLGLPGH